MQRLTATAPIALAILTALLLSGCGSTSGGDLTNADAAAAQSASEAAVTNAPAETADAEPATTEEGAATAEAAATAATADDAGAWAAAAAGAQRFAAALDHANQAIASCETDTSAGADFEACVGRSYQEIADASAALEGIVADAASIAGGSCAEALGATRDAAAAMRSDYARAVAVKDRTSRETIRATLADDAQAYADAALAAESACAA